MAAPEANIFPLVTGDSREENQGLPDELARLPPGRHGLPREFVEHNQRQRLMASLVNVVAERGYNGATITAVIEGASITSATFYKYFADVEACYMAAFDSAVEQLGQVLSAAYDAEPEWPLKIRAAIAAGIGFFAERPELGRFCLVEPFVAGPTISRHYQESIERLAPYLREGRALSRTGTDLPKTTERGLLGSIAAQVGRKITSPDQLPGLVPDLTQFALTPYLGSAEARRVGHSA